jgi:hypothetical protein
MKDNHVAKHAQRSGAGPHTDRKAKAKRVRGSKHKGASASSSPLSNTWYQEKTLLELATPCPYG